MFKKFKITQIKAIPLSIVFILFFITAHAQYSVHNNISGHQRIFIQKMNEVQPTVMADGVLKFGKTFLGDAYPKAKKAAVRQSDGTRQYLSTSNEELDVNLTQFNCVTFVENMIALTQTRLSSNPNFEYFKQNLANIRYRNGVIDYASRLHYFSDWLYENEKRGILTNITQEIGGQPFNKNVSYLSSSKNVLTKNKSNYTTFVSMKKVEKEISSRPKYFIPKDRIPEVESKIKNGDIIGITNRLEGMDMAHTGFAIWRNGQLYLMHASSQYHRVVISSKPLKDYLAGNKLQTGIMVGRLN